MFLPEVFGKIFLPGKTSADTFAPIMCIEVSWIRVGDVAEGAYRSIICMSDRIWRDAIVFCGMGLNMPSEAVMCGDRSRVFADKAPPMVVIGCSS